MYVYIYIYDTYMRTYLHTYIHVQWPEFVASSIPYSKPSTSQLRWDPCRSQKIHW